MSASYLPASLSRKPTLPLAPRSAIINWELDELAWFVNTEVLECDRRRDTGLESEGPEITLLAGSGL